MQGFNCVKFGSKMSQLTYLFDVYDIDHSGTISTKELEQVLQCLNPEMSSAQVAEACQDIFLEADTDSDLRLTKKEFTHLAFGKQVNNVLPANSSFMRGFAQSFSLQL